MALDYLEKYDIADQAASDQLGQVKNFVVSTATDFVATLHNSTLGLLPGIEDVKTRDWLEKIDQDSLAFYEENESLVSAASFVAGIVIPGAVSLKAVNAARAGVLAHGFMSNAEKTGKVYNLARTAVNTFTGTKKKLLVSEIEKAFAQAGHAAPGLSKLKRQLWADAIANFGFDAAATEVGLVLTMNAHPYMEDYMGDSAIDTAISFGKGMLYGMAFSPLAIPARLREVRQVTGAIETRAFTDVFSEILPYGQKAGGPQIFKQNATRMQVAQVNLDRLGQLKKRDFNGYTQLLIDDQILKASEEFTDAFKTAVPFIDEAKQPELAKWMKDLLLDSSNGQIELLKPVKLTGGGKQKLSSKILEKQEFLDLLEEADKKAVAFVRFRPDGTPVFYAREGIQGASRAVDLPGLKLADFKVPLYSADTDWAIIATTGQKSTAKMDGQFLGGLQEFDKLPVSKFQFVKIADNDLPSMNGIISRYAKGEVLPSITVVGEKSSALQSGQQLIDTFTNKTEEMINAMVSYQKFSFDEIATRLGVKTEAVQAVAVGGHLSDIQGWRRYTDASKIFTEYLNPKYKMHSIYGAPYKNPILEGIKNLDARTAHSMHLEFLDDVVMTGDSLLAKEAHAIYAGEEMKNYIMGLRDRLGLFNNSLVGSHKWQSADNALREVAFAKDGSPLGALITALGKSNTLLTDSVLKRYIEPFAETFLPMKGKDAAIAEFSNARNVLMGMKGWRQMYIDPDTGWAFFINQQIPKDLDLSNFQNLKQLAYRRGDEIFYIKQKEVVDALVASQIPARELFKLHNTIRRVVGKSPIEDLGFYLPPTPLVNKYRAYVIDPTGLKQTEVIVANTAEELTSQEQLYRQEVISQFPHLRIVKPSETEAYNLINNYLEGGSPYVTFADVSLRHGGSSKLALVPADSRAISETIEGLEFQMIAGLRKFNDLQMYDITSTLTRISDFNQSAFKGQALFGASARKADKDAAQHIRNILLGRKSTDLTTGWKVTEDLFDRSVNYVGSEINKLTESMKFNNQEQAYANFEKLTQEFKSLGIENPWRSFQEYFQSLRSDSSTFSQRLVSAASSLISTLQLRLLDAGFIIANLASLPILGSSTMWENVDALKLSSGAKIKLGTKTLMDGVAFMWTPEGKAINEVWEKQGLVNQAVRQYAETTAIVNAAPVSKQATEQAIQAVNRFISSDAVKLLTTPADFTENLTRQIMMNIGYTAAKKAYPGIGDVGATIYATYFTDRAIGNYFAAQRPMFFQGTLGSTIGLYQTYMVTFAQSVFRGLEQKAYGKLAAVAAMQAGIFGLSSMPGFQITSELIGKHYSNDNYDLTTGTYRALGEEGAELVLYGLPSSIFDTALHVRGDITPRVPSFTNVPIVSTTVNTIQAIAHGVEQITNAPDTTGKLRAFGEALSLQTVSRPLARLSEVATGNSITREGRTVSPPEDVWTVNGVFSRLLAMRPIEEQKLRDMIHLDKYYGSADYEARQKVIRGMRIAIRDGNLSDQMVEESARDYIAKGGSAKGWTSAMNEVMLLTPYGARLDFLRKLEADSPLRQMINDNF